ncbi:hypothetical protein ACFCYN_14995 [Gottfriedia sp. NPDC056225]|uniref:hypothetical protein n=1 Tax=Gottfriedia sp. NPDC056225 TaxID=3345751 RepID=UPI0035DF2656
MDIKIHIHDEYMLAGENLIKNSEEQKKEISLWFKELIKAFVESEDNFVLDDLKHIYVAKDYAKELYEFQTKKGLNQGHTKNEISEGQAMVLSYKKELGEEETSIFFRAEFIFGLYSYQALKEEFQDEVTMLFNTFFHELCHINDDYHTKKLFDKDEIEKCTIIPRNLYPFSIGMWKEYYAYRKAAERFPYGDLLFSHLDETSLWAYKEVVTLHEKYVQDDNMDEFMLDFTSKMRYLLRVMVSVIGNVQGYTSDVNGQDELFKVALQILPNKKLKNVFNRLLQELDMLFHEYPTWRDLSRLAILNDIVLDCFNAFGVFPSDVGNDQMFVGIDFI